MTGFGRGLRGEILKLRRGLVPWLVVAAPLLVVAVRALEWSRRPVDATGEALAWAFWGQSVLVVWAMLVLPLFVALEAALVAGLEHRTGGWTRAFTLPLSRVTIYIAKLVVLVGLVALASVVLAIGAAGAGLALAAVRPELGLAGSPPIGAYAGSALLVAASAGTLVALHLWLSARWSEFALGIGIAVGGVVAGLVVANTTLGPVFPWSSPVHVAQGEAQARLALVVAVVGGVVGAVLGARDLARRDVT